MQISCEMPSSPDRKDRILLANLGDNGRLGFHCEALVELSRTSAEVADSALLTHAMSLGCHSLINANLACIVWGALIEQGKDEIRVSFDVTTIGSVKRCNSETHQYPDAGQSATCHTSVCSDNR
ncbi:PREDICTED: uncharacterized protein LOC106805819 [Priapulus caudatus]|uniref:Uncharacterized protein LOC106805819 n=1 Tax=Priapulus caudatus TaxID=37621 RepID=A0ABM1DSX9_PRICU|nr:PREDICTED: uncharacterized protein LOC106805819 [Priapulus caudatus]